MTLPKQKFREVVLQILFGVELQSSTEDRIEKLLMEQLSLSKKYIRQAQAQVAAIRPYLSSLDHMIGTLSKEYRFERIPEVEKAILRLALYEMEYDPTIPPKVSIAEGIRLARKFSSPESATFINALLDAHYKNL